MTLGIPSCAHFGTPTLQVADARGLPVRVVQFHRRDAADPVDTRVTQQRYDAAGRLVASRDPYLFGLAQADAATPYNLLQVPSLSGVTLLTVSVDAGWRVGLRGQAGQNLEAWDGRGSDRRAEFDELLRPVMLREGGVGVTEHVLERFTYADAGPEAAAHNLCGQLVRHDDPAGTVLVQEAGLSGLLLKHTRQFLTGTEPPDWPLAIADRDALLESGAGLTTFDAYAASGDALSQTDAMGNIQSSGYTRAGQLKDARLTLAGAGQSEKLLVSDLHYNAIGQIEAETAGNGVITRHRYDEANGRLIELSAHKSDGTPLQQLQYAYDAVGNVLSIEDAAQPIRYFNNQRIEPIKTYRYDTLDQLIEATGSEAVNGSGGPTLPDLQPLPVDPSQIANYTQTFHYDSGGNLLNLVHVGAQSQGRTLTRAKYSNRCLPEHDGRPPTEAELAAGFDANGNLQELQPGQRLVWDLRNQLREVKPVVREDADDDRECYVYDGSGQRVRKVRSSVTKARTMLSEVRYLPGLEIRSHGGTGEILHVINASAGSNSVQVLHWVANPPDEIAQNQLRYSLNDQVKSSTLELDQNADVISWEWYYAFGGTARWAGRNNIEAKYKTVRYSGKERDATGLLYYGLRYYAPWLQRWINPDPAGYTDGINLYSMVGNSPIVNFDNQGRNGERFNHEQYLSDFKQILRRFQLKDNYVKGFALNDYKRYKKKLLKMDSLETDEQKLFFRRQVLKLGKTLRSSQSVLNDTLPYRDTSDIEGYRAFLGNLRKASYFQPFAESAHATRAESSGHPEWWEDVFDFDWEAQWDAPTGTSDFSAGAPPQPSPSSTSRHAPQAGPSRARTFREETQPGRATSPNRGRSRTGAGQATAAQQPNAPTPLHSFPMLPTGTDSRIIEGYELALRIMANEGNERAIFPEGFKRNEFMQISRKIHPDRLKLEGASHVSEAATRAFQIIGNWKVRSGN
ncbi:RHS repeat domain-containing protein [Pseudomonas sp. MYb118]|uniref:RHS repeat domain-containing protein n=1 Tax=Pseudomonas sp. MYb118 TaxID=1848720 RepID=UPI0034CF1040